VNRVCVFCGSLSGIKSGYLAAAERLGRVLADRGVGLVYGGGRVGLMGEIANAVLARQGYVIGVIPRALVEKELAHKGLTDLRIVSSMHERKAMMAELGDAFIAMPGGLGTVEEFVEVLTWAQLGLHTKPCGLLNVGGYFDPLLAFFQHAVREGFVAAEHARLVISDTEPTRLLDRLASYRPVARPKWIGRTDS
jgi:uncharacterized protein (TIGR00730 family)